MRDLLAHSAHPRFSWAAFATNFSNLNQIFKNRFWVSRTRSFAHPTTSNNDPTTKSHYHTAGADILVVGSFY